MNVQYAPPRKTPARRDGDASLGTALTRIWPVFALSWPMFMLTGPVAQMFASADTPPERTGTLAWAVAFLGAYGWLTLYRPFRTNVERRERQVQVALLLVLTGLVLYLDLASGPGQFWLFIAVNIAVGVVLPPRPATWIVGAVTALATGVEVPRSGWSAVMMVPGISIWGLAAILLRRLVLVIDRLRLAREERARLAVAEERLRFARDLHDLLGHSLSLIALKSELAGRLVQTSNPRAVEEIADIERVARRSLREVRETVTGYRQPALGDELQSVRDMLLAAKIEPHIDVAMGKLPPPIDAALAWAVREATTNVIRHSHAHCCSIRIWRDGANVRADITDDGRFPTTRVSSETAGSGLAGIAERVAACGGTMEAGDLSEGGFALRVSIPVVREIRQVPDPAAIGQAMP